MMTLEEAKAQITRKAVSDESFCATLLADPRSAVHLVLPPAATDLDVDELRGVRGGLNC